MEEDNKSIQKMELVILRKTGCFGIQHVHKVSNQLDHREKQECYRYLYSEDISEDRGHNSLMISGLLMLSDIGHFYRLIQHAIPHLSIMWD